jgi:hypothetical protein
VISQASALQVSVQDFSFVTNYNYAPVFAGNSSVPIATACANGFAGIISVLQVSYGSLQTATNSFEPSGLPVAVWARIAGISCGRVQMAGATGGVQTALSFALGWKNGNT